MKQNSLTKTALTGLVAIVFGLAALPAASSSHEVGDPIRGQTLFVSKHCVRCHAIRGTGGRTGPDLGRTAMQDSFYDTAAKMWNHSPVMGQRMQELHIPVPSLEKNDLADLIAFVHLLNYFDEPGDPGRGKVIFAEKHCIQCHRVGKVGGTAGPRLDSLPRDASPLRMAQHLWNHGPEMVRAVRAKGLDIPQFMGSEIIDLFAYLRSQGEDSGASQFESVGDHARGQALFQSTGCDSCHEIFGDGEGIGPDLGRAELRGSVTQIAGRMWNHFAAMADAGEALEIRMPEFAGSDLGDILAYVFRARFLGETGDVGRGQTVYLQRDCGGCHGPEGQGRIALGLVEVTPGQTHQAVFQKMWNHTPLMYQKMSARQIPWPRFAARELADLLVYLTDGLAPEDADSVGHGGSN